MTPRERCSTGCNYKPLAQHSGVRPPPWTREDAGLQYHACSACGSVTIQRFDSNSGFGQLWILSPASIVLFRFAITPQRLFDYVLSDDFFSNSSITEMLYQGHIAELNDASACANLLIPALQEHDEPEYLEMLLRLLNITLEETILRTRMGKEIRLSFATLVPLMTIAKGVLRVMHYAPTACAKVRVMALEVLETLARPELTKFLRPAEFEEVEKMIDHKLLLDRSRQDTIAARKRIHSNGAAVLEMEAAYLLEVFQQRGAQLTDIHASLIWGCMRDIYARLATARSARLAVGRCYNQLQLLLEQQLWFLNFLEVESPVESQRRFQNHENKLVVVFQRLYPEVTVYTSTSETTPVAVFDAWHDLYTYLTEPAAS